MDEKKILPNPTTPEQADKDHLVATEDVNKRIKPAMAVIRELMAKIDSKRKKEAEEKATKDSIKLAEQNAQIVQEAPKQIYVSLDGDNIGNAVARAEEKDDEKTLADISRRINNGQEVLKQWAATHGGKLIEAGGDEGLVKVPGYAQERVEELREQYKRVVGATATVGIGSTISESTKARMLGKLRGKNRVVVWEPEMQKEMQLRMQEKGTSEAGKIQAAGLGGETGPVAATKEAPAKEQEPEEKPKESAPSKQGAHRYVTSDDELKQFQDEDEEPSWTESHQMIAPEEEEDEPHPSTKEKLPEWVIDEAISRGFEPHTYARLLRSYGNRV